MPSWNHTLEDTDPFFNYTPFADGDYTAGWAPWFAGSGGFLAEAPGELGKGQSMHWTAAPGASVEVEFHGTAVYLYGSANCTYDVTIDDVPVASGASSDIDLLFSKNDLSLGRHFLSLTAHATPIGQFAFDKAIVSDDFPEGVDELVPIVVDNQNSTLEYSGEWNLISDSQIPSRAAPNPYRQTTDSAASVSLNFTGTAVAIHSPVNWGHWTYNVSLDGVQRSYNSSTYWLIGDTQLFWASGLDINKTHHIELTNTAGSGMFMTLNDITVYTKNGSSLLDSQSSLEGPKVNPAVLAGPIIAAMIGIMVILTGAYFLRRRRAREQLVNAVPEPYFGTSAPVETTFTAYAPDSDAAEKGQEIIVVVSPPAASALATHVYRNERATVDSDAASVEERTWYNPHSPTSHQTFSQTGAQLSHSTSTQSHYTSTTESDQPHPAPHEVPPRYSH